LVRLDTSDHRLLHVDLPLRIVMTGKIELLPGAVSDIYGGGHDTLRFDLGGPGEKELGDLRVRCDRGTATGPALLQLLTAQGNVLREARLSEAASTVEWKLLPAGTYSLKLIEDLNGNGRWDTGSLDDHRPCRTGAAPSGRRQHQVGLGRGPRLAGGKGAAGPALSPRSRLFSAPFQHLATKAGGLAS
jgi:hypothetical protein